MRVKYFLASLMLLVAVNGCAQDKHKKKRPEGGEQHINQNFINTLMGVVSYVPDDFKLIRGEQMKSTGTETRYRSKWKVAQTEWSNIVHDTGWRFEALIHESVDKTKLAAFYEEYARHLQTVPNAGYILTEKTNTDPALADQPDIIYRHKTGTVTIAMKATRSTTGMYTLMVYVSK